MGPWGWFLAAAAAAVVGTLGRDTPTVVAKLATGGGCGKANRPLAESLAQKWGPVFGVSVQTLLSICKIESGFKAGCLTMTGGAIKKGGAWGLMQQTLDTAKGNVASLRNHANADVRQAVARFDGTGTSLLDADLNMCLGAYQLGRLTAEFGSDFAAVALGYHSGASVPRKMKAAGIAVTADNVVESRPNGKIYVARALAARESIG